jgi:glycosyl transferase family 87
MTTVDRGAHRRQRLYVIFSVVLLLAYGRQLLSAPTAGQDFRAFFAAATVAAQSGDPYDWAALGRTEDALYNAPAHIRPGDARFYDFLPYPEGPWLALALEPLSSLPWQSVYPAFAAIMLLAIGVGGWLVLTQLGWSPRRRRIAVAVACLSPIAFFNVFQGQVSAIVLVGFAAAWYLAAKGRPVLGGLALTLVWVKPNLGLALPVVMVLLQPSHARRLLISFLAGSLLAFAAAAVALPGVPVSWFNELWSHWRAVQGAQPDVASLHSFYYPALGGVAKTLALALVMLAGAGYGVWALRQLREPLPRALTALLLWFAFLPYVHSFDAILLLPVVAFVLGPELEGWTDPLTELTLWAFAIIPFAYFLGLRIGFFNGFTAIPVALLVFAWHRRVVNRPARPEDQAVAA